MENRITYDKVSMGKVNGGKIHYGIIYGNEKVLFIKTGSGGNIKGYKDKYLKISVRAHSRIGATIICASNPENVDYYEQILSDKEKIVAVAEELGLSSYEVYMFGCSDGAYHNIVLAKEIPEITKMLCVNTSIIDFDDLKYKLADLPCVNKVLAYGEMDDEYMHASDLKELNLDNLRVITIEGADHKFTGMVDKFIDAVDLILK